VNGIGIDSIIVSIRLQVSRVLPKSILYGRRLLKEGDYVISVNGKSAKNLTIDDCDVLVSPSSTVVCVELLRKVDLKESKNGDDPGCSPGTLNSEKEDPNLEQHEGRSPYRCSLPNELNRNELFARSRLRLADDASACDGKNLEQVSRKEQDEVGRDRQRVSSQRPAAPDSVPFRYAFAMDQVRNSRIEN